MEQACLVLPSSDWKFEKKKKENLWQFHLTHLKYFRPSENSLLTVCNGQVPNDVAIAFNAALSLFSKDLLTVGLSIPSDNN